jgi:hypothetical protein
MRQRGLTCIEPTVEAEDACVAHVNEVAYRALYPKAASWYMSANILRVSTVGVVGVSAEGYIGYETGKKGLLWRRR